MTSSPDSPDPLTLPSSPLARRSYTHALGSPRRASISPSKTFHLDTTDLLPRQLSPYRLRVTVEAEPHPDSPRRQKPAMQTRRIALKGGSSSSPAKGAPGEGKRKRKGTPIARRSKARLSSPIPEPKVHEYEDVGAAVIPVAPSSELRGQRIPLLRNTKRFQRLSAARQELDLALQAAVGSSSPRPARLGKSSPHAGEMTVANEDFTMITGESLASIKETLGGGVAGERSGVSGVQWPSSPPALGMRGRVEWPDVEAEATEARTVGYDAMSWVPTGKAIDLTRHVEPDGDDMSMGAESSGDEYDEDEVAEDGYVEDEPGLEGDAEVGDVEDDIWAEEASRSIEDLAPQADKSILSRHREPLPSVPPIFSDQPEPPRRSKLPRTWRRVSGNDFTYSDSPAHDLAKVVPDTVEEETRSDAGSRRSSGVLTPPSTDDERRQGGASAGGEDDSAETSGLTEPEDADTLLEAQRLRRQPQKQAGPLLAERNTDRSLESSALTDSRDETGLYWRQSDVHMKGRPVPQARATQRTWNRPQDHELSDIFAMNHTDVLQGTPAPVVVAKQMTPKNAAREARRAERKAKREATRREHTTQSQIVTGTRIEQTTYTASLEESHTTALSLASKASDQRQILGDMSRAATPAQFKPQALPQMATVNELLRTQQQRQEELARGLAEFAPNAWSTDASIAPAEVSQSYEEHLNLDSPQKIRVKFDDSTQQTSDPLAPRMAYSPLFDESAKAQHQQIYRNQAPVIAHQYPTLPSFTSLLPIVASVADLQTVAMAKVSRVTTAMSNLKSALWYPFPDPSIPLPAANIVVPATPRMRPAKLLTPTTPFPQQTYLSRDRRTQLRKRYGVIPFTHPFTLVHMRTLHRMLLSTMREPDTLISHRSLPMHLAALVNTVVPTPDEREFVFTKQCGGIVEAFMALLVDESVVKAMDSGEVGFLGDKEARRERGVMGGRQPDEVVWEDEVADGTVIEWEWVVSALGGAVLIEEGKKEKATIALERA
ncbi:hypothetical protein B0A48_08455 [Cryoendolithus antarcticus]|uniref:Uncharacterized protein n=1 Tax=Cryoendolithus antarcticus TaxID=1507870 RepID=A0A1V8T605_9PEZI|nr:hypothetical protein B0A48_08455 [Cryoendolithus antarcticus]